MLCLSGFKLYSRWVPLINISCFLRQKSIVKRMFDQESCLFKLLGALFWQIQNLVCDLLCHLKSERRHVNIQNIHFFSGQLVKQSQCIYVVVQFYPWFKFSFLLFQPHDHVIIIHYHTQKQKKRKYEPRIKLNHNIYIRVVNNIHIITK